MNNFFPVPEGNTDLVSTDLAADLVEVGSAVDTTGVQYLKFTKIGTWVFGPEDDQLGADEVLAVNPASFTIGWAGWEDGKPQDGQTLPIGQRSELMPESELPALKPGKKNGWMRELGVQFRTIEDGITMSYHTGSYSGKQAVTKLMKEIGLGLQAHPEAPVALVKLSGDSYKHKEHGDIQTPEITVIGWADADGKEVKKLAA